MIELAVDWLQRREDPHYDLTDDEVLGRIAELEEKLDGYLSSHRGSDRESLKLAKGLRELYRSAENRKILPKREPTEADRRRVDFMERNGKPLSRILLERGPFNWRGHRKSKATGSRDRRRDPDELSWLEVILEGVTGFLD